MHTGMYTRIHMLTRTHAVIHTCLPRCHAHMLLCTPADMHACCHVYMLSCTHTNAVSEAHQKPARASESQREPARASESMGLPADIEGATARRLHSVALTALASVLRAVTAHERS